MPPNAQTQGHLPEMVQSAVRARVYKSSRASQQVRFPGRRKVVKTYSRRGPAQSFKQQTLTQVDYVVTAALSPEDADWYSRSDQDGQDAIERTGGTENCPGDTEKDDTHYSSSKSPVASRKPKMAQPGSTPVMKSMMHFTSERAARAERVTYDGGISKGSRATVIQDSDDEIEVRSPGTKYIDTPQKPEGHTSPRLLLIPQTPKRRQLHGMETVSSSTTPPTVRSEIPSSQPSPFTPVLFPDRYHSPLGKLRYSPLQRKSEVPVDAICSDLAVARGGWSDRTTRPVVPRKRNSELTTAVSDLHYATKPPALLYTKGNNRSASSANQQTRLQLLFTEKPRLSSRQKSVLLSNSLDEDVYSHLSQQKKQREEMLRTEEIPDTDEEEELCGMSPLFPNGMRLSPVAVRPADVSQSDTASILSLSDLEPGTPTPRRKRQGNGNISGGRREDQPSMKSRRPPLSSASCVDTRRSDASMRTAGRTPGPETRHSQGLESQRVPLEAINDLGPQTDRSDIIISVQPEQAQKIIDGTRDHEFRNYKIPQTVCRFWLYVGQPTCELQYMTVVRGGLRQPGEIDSNSGEGNAEFNSGQMVANFAYRLAEVYQLNNPVPLETMKKSGWVDGPPQRYTYVPPAVVGALLANLRCRLLVSVHDRTVGDGLSADETAEEALSISQEIETQLLCGLPDGQLFHRQRAPIPRTAHVNPAGRYEDDSYLKGGGARPTRSLTGTVSKSFTQGETHSTSGQGCVVIAGKTGSTADISSLDDDMHQKDIPMSSQKTARQHRLVQASLSADSTQIVMPDSLYEEVRQAPPAVILDSEDEDEEDG